MRAKILILSDTHWYDSSHMPEFLENSLGSYDAIIHTGDFVSSSVMELLAAYNTLFAVCGNCDESCVRRVLPEQRLFNLGGLNIGLIHGAKKSSSYIYELHSVFPTANLVVFGHSHIPLLEKVADTVFFNPGSLTHPRGGHPPSAGLLEIDDCGFSIDHMFFQG